MKKILTLALVFGLGTALFADTLWLPKFTLDKIGGSEVRYFNLENMKRVTQLTNLDTMKEDEYIVYDNGLLVYKIDGKIHKTSMYEIIKD